MGLLLIDELTNLLECQPEKLTQFLCSQSNRSKISLNLRWCLVQTTYKNKNGQKHKFYISDITGERADELLTYGRLRKPWNVTICQFYFARHRIRLRYPAAPCAIEETGLTGKKFYPVELLELCDENFENRDTTLLNSFSNLQINGQNQLYKNPTTTSLSAERKPLNFPQIWSVRTKIQLLKEEDGEKAQKLPEYEQKEVENEDGWNHGHDLNDDAYKLNQGLKDLVMDEKQDA